MAVGTTAESVKRRRAKNWKPYDYENTYSEELDSLEEEQLIRMIHEQRKAIYATKTIRYGGQMDVEAYPEFTRLPGTLCKKCSPEAKKDLNDRNSRKECERRIGENFGSSDFWITLSYMPNEEPEDIDAALRDMQNYIKRLNYQRKKMGIPAARYVYVTDWTKNRRRVRTHHHVVIDGEQSATDLLAAWKKGRRNKATPLVLDEDGLSGLSRYMTKPHAADTEDIKHRRKWCASKNLRRPEERKNHQTFRRRKVEHLAQHPADMQHILEKLYPGFWFERGTVRYNGHCGLFYLSATLREKAAPGDVVTISGRPEALEEINEKTRQQLRDHREFLLLALDGTTATIGAASGRGKTWQVPLRACIVDRRREGAKKTWS